MPVIPPPLNTTPSRARVRLAARLAQRKQDEIIDSTDMNANPNVPDTSPTEASDSVTVIEQRPTSFSSRSSYLETHEPPSNRFADLFASSSSDSDAHTSSDEDEEDDEDSFAGSPRNGAQPRPHNDYNNSFSNSREGNSEQAIRRQIRNERRSRRPSTTTAKERKPLDDDDDVVDASGSNDNKFDEVKALGTKIRGSEGGHGGNGGDSGSEGDEEGSRSSEDEGLVEMRTRRRGH